MFKMFSERFLYRDKRGKGWHKGMIHQPESFAKSRAEDKISDEIAKSKQKRLKEQDVMEAQLHADKKTEKPAEQEELAKSEVVWRIANAKLEVERESREARKNLADEFVSGLA